MAISVIRPLNTADGSDIINSSRTASVPFTNTSNYVPQLNDVVVLFPSARTACTLTIPAGWVNALGGTTDAFSGSNELCCIYHLVTAAEVTAATTTYTATNLYEATKQGNTLGCVLRGVDSTNVIDSTNTWVNNTSGSTTYTIPGLTGANLSTNSMVVSVIGTADNTGAGSLTTPAGWTNRNFNGSFHKKAMYTLDALTTAGADVSSVNSTGSVSALGAAITVAFNIPGATNTGQFFAMF